MDSLNHVNANVQGVIVNGVDQNPYYNEYGYNYGYQMLGGYYYGRYGGYGKYYDQRPEEREQPPAKAIEQQGES